MIKNVKYYRWRGTDWVERDGLEQYFRFFIASRDSIGQLINQSINIRLRVSTLVDKLTINLDMIPLYKIYNAQQLMIFVKTNLFANQIETNLFI